jgi:3-oxoadipate enol-lactonase
MPSTLFLHGLGTGPGAWGPQREALADRTTAAPRLPPIPDGAFHVARGELLRLPSPVDVCGLSLGAVTALRLAAAEPGRVRRLVVTAAFARLPRRLAALQLALAAAAALVPPGRLVRGLTREVPEPYRAEGVRALAAIRSGDVARALARAARLDLRADVRRVGCPALVLCGDRDRINIGLSQALAGLLPNARFALVPRAGHVANLDNAAAFNALLLSFLAS